MEACFWVGVKNSGRWNPPFQDRDKLLPLLLRSLTAASQNVTPQPVYAPSEDAQLVDVAGNGVVLVVTGYDLAKQ